MQKLSKADRDLMEMIHTMGATTFVQYLPTWYDDRPDDKWIIKELMRKEGYAESSAITKLWVARRIIRQKKVKRALQLISDMNPEKVKYNWIPGVAGIMADGII